MRLLLTSPGGSAEGGAAQVALRLRDALRQRGLEVDFWEPPPHPARRYGSRLWSWRSSNLEDFAQRNGPFDAIDVLPVLATPRLAQIAPLIVRSIQPELTYLGLNLRGGLTRPRLAFILSALDAPLIARRVVRGLHAGNVVLCLTDSEIEGWARRFQSLRPRLSKYRIAPSAPEQEQLRVVAHERSRRPHRPTRLLWIGRWVRHKGTHLLAAFAPRWLAEHPADSLTIAGCGSAEDTDLRRLTRNDRVVILPSFPRSQLPVLLASHDVGLFTSVAEGWGLSLNEMLESGMPVYATEAGGVPDLRRFFPSQLRPFPPRGEFEPGRPDDPLATGYDSEFSWPAIADRYVAVVGAAVIKPRRPEDR